MCEYKHVTETVTEKRQAGRRERDDRTAPSPRGREAGLRPKRVESVTEQ